MLDKIKTMIWEKLADKEISLAMLINKEGEIVWYKGRSLENNGNDQTVKTIENTSGFSKSRLKYVLANQQNFYEDNVLIRTESLSVSALELNIRSLLIIPVSRQYYLYLDSGIKSSFSPMEIEMFQSYGSMLSEMMDQIQVQDEMELAGNSAEMAQVRQMILKYSIADDPVLLTGETGVGKSHIAKLIHHHSGRSGRLVTVNTPSIAENLFESELFGYKRGAFTDARADKPGLVDEAANGTLFFDEISEVPLSFQAKLLWFIEEKKYFIMGDTRERQADVRIIAATNKDLPGAILDKEFRQDLYYRLNILPLHIPPLRIHKNDIKNIAQTYIHFLKGKQPGAHFWESMSQHEWPGNIRELITVLKRAGVICNDPITGEEIWQIIHHHQPAKQKFEADSLWQEMKAGKSFFEVVKKPFLDRELNRDQVKAIIRLGLAETNGRYIDLLPLFNIEKNKYNLFMSFLSDNQLKG
jgi:transcriptional regulator with PAS, ATPase and Fis domain